MNYSNGRELMQRYLCSRILPGSPAGFAQTRSGWAWELKNSFRRTADHPVSRGAAAAPTRPLTLWRAVSRFALTAQAGAVAATACASTGHSTARSALYGAFSPPGRRVAHRYSILRPLPPDLFPLKPSPPASGSEAYALDPSPAFSTWRALCKRPGSCCTSSRCRRYALVKINVIRFRYINQSCGSLGAIGSCAASPQPAGSLPSG